MQVRFVCPACGGQHVFDTPEGTVSMTCARTGKTIQVTVTPGGDAKPKLLDATQEAQADDE